MISRRDVIRGAAAAGAGWATRLDAALPDDDNDFVGDVDWLDWRSLIEAAEEYPESWALVRDVMFADRPNVTAVAKAIEAELVPVGDAGDMADAAWQAWQELLECERAGVIVRSMGALGMDRLTLSDDNASDLLKVFRGVARLMVARVWDEEGS